MSRKRLDGLLPLGEDVEDLDHGSTKTRLAWPGSPESMGGGATDVVSAGKESS